MKTRLRTRPGMTPKVTSFWFTPERTALWTSKTRRIEALLLFRRMPVEFEWMIGQPLRKLPRHLTEAPMPTLSLFLPFSQSLQEKTRVFRSRVIHASESFVLGLSRFTRHGMTNGAELEGLPMIVFCSDATATETLGDFRPPRREGQTRLQLQPSGMPEPLSAIFDAPHHWAFAESESIFGGSLRRTETVIARPGRPRSSLVDVDFLLHSHFFPVAKRRKIQGLRNSIEKAAMQHLENNPKDKEEVAFFAF
jgi:hypothetical protein